MTPEQDLLKLLNEKKPTAPSEGSAMEEEIKGDPDYSTPLTLRNIFIHHDSHPIVIKFALIKAFGFEWLKWEPETIWSEIKRVFQSEISEHARAKIHCLRALVVGEQPWNSWQVFEKVIQGLNNNIPKWTLMQAPSLEQLYAGVDIIMTIRENKFGDEVRRYMAAAVLNEDIFYVPPPLDFIQVEVSQPYYHCKDCQNEDSALFHDGLCDTCTRKFGPEAGLGFRPDPDALAAGKGKNTELRLKFDPSSIESKWKQVMNLPSDKVELEENQVDIQIAKLLIARDYLNIRRKQLADQLIALKSWLGSV
jgi:hypothetical protein